VVHEPYNRHGGPGTRDFWTSVEDLAESARVVKHHPGNLLSDRQNTHLYRRWLDSGGTIVHLVRRDLTAQARSLLIARNLNSFHRGHRVGEVDPGALALELADLREEVGHQSALLGEFPTVEISYEEILDGPVGARLDALTDLVGRIDPALVPEQGWDPPVRELLSPAGRVRPPEGEPVVRLVAEIPTMWGWIPLMGEDECREWEHALDPLTRGRGGLRGLTVAPAEKVMGEKRVRELVHRISEAMTSERGIRLLPEAARSPVLMAYDGEHHPDHDLTLHHPLPPNRDLAVDFAVGLSPPDQYGGGGVHLSGVGVVPPSPEAGRLLYFSSAVGGRRQAVSSGHLAALSGRIPLAPGQLLAPGQVLSSGDHWR